MHLGFCNEYKLCKNDSMKSHGSVVILRKVVHLIKGFLFIINSFSEPIHVNINKYYSDVHIHNINTLKVIVRKVLLHSSLFFVFIKYQTKTLKSDYINRRWSAVKHMDDKIHWWLVILRLKQ